MMRNLSVLLVLAAVVALPFALRQPRVVDDWRPGDPVLVVMTPHNQAIRYEFGRGFAAWHKQNFGRPVRTEWLNVGGTTEISRYFSAQYVAAFRAWWRAQGKPWPATGAEDLLSATATTAVHDVFRAIDDPQAFTSQIDLFFGGGEYDHTLAFRQGLTVPPWPAGRAPREVLAQVPERVSGETWRTATLFGNALSTFGICFNRDRLRDLGVRAPPTRWDDVADPVYCGQVAVADPTKSGSYAKAFEMILQQKCAEAVRAAGISGAAMDEWTPAVQAAVATGWRDGMRLIQRIGANARYFTDSSSKVPIDVAAGDAAVGLTIDFYARFQAQMSGRGRMGYVTPVGGSSVSCDPVSLLRGAPHRALAVRFIEFVLSTEGQRLWNDDPAKPCSVAKKFALRRLPIRRDFYPPHLYPQGCATDNLADPAVNPYALAETFTYRAQWTGRQFNVQRDLVRAMCLDSGDELQAAWRAIIQAGMPRAALEALGRLPDRPEPVTWASAPQIVKKYDRLVYMQQWTEFFRQSYREAKRLAESCHSERSEESHNRLGAVRAVDCEALRFAQGDKSCAEAVR